MDNDKLGLSHFSDDDRNDNDNNIYNDNGGVQVHGETRGRRPHKRKNREELEGVNMINFTETMGMEVDMEGVYMAAILVKD